MMKTLWVGLSLGLFLAGQVSAGTSSNPEITDDPTDSLIWEPEVIPHLEITKAWIQPKGDQFHFSIEVAGMPKLEDIPKDAVYVWHYSWHTARLYWSANWTDDGSEFQFRGGVYQGCKPPFCSSHDLEGQRKYVYLRGNESQKERIGGFVDAGNPGRIVWTYPMESFGEDRRGLTFNGLFVTTYKQVPAEEAGSESHPIVHLDSNRLRYIDTAQAAEDVKYEHKIHVPWWAKFTPGPSPLLVVAVATAAIVGLGRLRR